MKYLYILFIFSIAASSCNRNNDTAEIKDPVQVLAGNDQKQWKATRETDSEGDKDRLTKSEKQETIVFYKNGNVSMSGGNQSMTGTWSHMGDVLTLHFAGENVTENFTILELDNNKMRLRAVDGSEMTLKPE